MPSILTGIDLSINAAFRMMIISELFGAPNGLGFRLTEASHYLDLKKVYALLIIIGFLGIFISFLFNVLKNKLLTWI